MNRPSDALCPTELTASAPQPDPQAWDFLDPRAIDPEPEPGDFWLDDDFEDWLEDI